ncbi:MAG: polysaccharide biosynthesis/export family protein [Verrucomicrobiota bacterium]
MKVAARGIHGERAAVPDSFRAMVVAAGLLLLVSSASAGGAEPQGKFQHRIIPGDRLRISVAEQRDLNRIYPVAGDGTIDFGFVGRIEVAEMTVSEAADKLKGLLEETYFKKATVAVEVAAFVEGNLLVMGAVKSPGTIPFSGGQILTVVEAISMCGGLAGGAAGTEVRILRWKPGGGTERQTMKVDVQSMFETLDFTKDQYLRPRDIVFVPSLGGGEGAREFLALGAVGAPGFHPYSPGLDVIRAFMRIGGLSGQARWNAVRILRPDKAGNYSIIPIDLGRLFGEADMRQNIPILAGDIVFAPSPEQASRGRVYMLGAAAHVGVVGLTLGEDNTLAKVLLASGGVGEFGNESKIRILRNAPDGSRQTLVVDVGRILKTGAFEDDVPLQDGDVVIVPDKLLSL